MQMYLRSAVQYSALAAFLNTKVTIWISMEVDEVSDSVEFLWVILPRLINLFSRKTKSL
ncbi:Uncharacterised protein [Escherichia coli]|nr:Uncharacterised protein [Escherichia coli]